MEIVLDIETSDLEGTDLWCVVAKDVATCDVQEFQYPQFVGLLDLIKPGVTLIGHNIIEFDYPVLRKHLPTLPSPSQIKIYDTLVVSRLLKFRLDGGHSLDAWGQRLRKPKSTHNDFSQPSPGLLARCRDDVEITHALYDYQARFRTDPAWLASFTLEHQIAEICYRMRRHGFWFDIDAAKSLHTELAEVLKGFDDQIAQAFLPRTKLIKEVHPKVTKHGSLSLSDFRFVDRVDGVADLSEYNGGPFSRIEFVPFNPGSPRQMVTRLNELGWEPWEKTKTHIEAERERPQNRARLEILRTYGWKVSEDNLDTLPETAPPEAHLLSQRMAVAARLSDLEEWLLAVKDDHRIHGQVMPIGTWPHRVAHSKPNTGNIAGKEPKKSKRTPVYFLKKKYDPQMRAMWGVPEGHLQIGVDIDAAHARILAHLMDDQRFIEALVAGDKDKGTDLHTLNQKALGDVCTSREASKVFFYSFVNGAGVGKVSSILQCSRADAKIALDNYIAFYPGLEKLYEEIIPRDAERGYFVGLDGRKVAWDEEHGMLAGYLQNAEKIILSRMIVDGLEWAEAEGIPIHPLNLVHDEAQLELYKDDHELAKVIGVKFTELIVSAGKHYGLRCPMKGDWHVGRNWLEVH